MKIMVRTCLSMCWSAFLMMKALGELRLVFWVFCSTKSVEDRPYLLSSYQSFGLYFLIYSHIWPSLYFYFCLPFQLHSTEHHYTHDALQLPHWSRANPYLQLFSLEMARAFLRLPARTRLSSVCRPFQLSWRTELPSYGSAASHWSLRTVSPSLITNLQPLSRFYLSSPLLPAKISISYSSSLPNSFDS